MTVMIAERKRCRRWRAFSRGATDSPAACSSRPIPKTGFIEPGSSNIAGLEALKTADLLVVFLRFQDFPDDEMQHIVDYLDRGGPVIGLRTATHAFQIKSAGREVREVHLEPRQRLSGRVRPADSR